MMQKMPWTSGRAAHRVVGVGGTPVPSMDVTTRPTVASQPAATAWSPGVRPRLDRTQLMLLALVDAVVLIGAAGGAAAVLRAANPVRAGNLALRDVVVTAAAMAIALHLHRLYDRPTTRLRPSGWWTPLTVARCVPTGALLALGTASLVFAQQRMTLTAAVVMTLPNVLLVPLGRRVVVGVCGRRTISRVLVAGTGPIAERVAARLRRCGDIALVGHVDDAPAPGTAVLGGLAELPALCRAHRADRVIVAFSRMPDEVLLDAVRRLRSEVAVSIVPRMFELHSWRSEVEELHGFPLAHLPPPSLGLRARLEKRALDLGLAVPIILVTLPVWLLAAAAIKIDSPGPVFFRQERTGRAGQPFRVFKFRTMIADAWQQRGAVSGRNEIDGPLFKMAADPRATRVGSLLRRTSIDELPQLLNVLRGEMSLVGPRPLPVEESDRLDGAALDRLHATPGITGLWQVSGRSDLTYADLQHLDSVYVRSWSLMWDLRILLATPRAVFGRRGAY